MKIGLILDHQLSSSHYWFSAVMSKCYAYYSYQ